MKLSLPPLRQLLSKDFQVAALYVLFACAWVFGTDFLSHRFSSHPSLAMGIALVRRVGLIALSTLLFYFLLQTLRGDELARMRTRQDHGLRGLLLVFVGLVLVVPVVGFGMIRFNVPQIRKAAFAELNAIAQLKTQQIQETLAGWQGDAEALAATTGFIADLDTWVQKGDPKAGARFRSRLASMERVYRFEATAFDPRGRVIYGKGLDAVSLDPLRPLMKEAVRTRKVQATDLHRNGGGRLRIDYVAPLFLPEEGGPRLAAVAILRAPVEDSLLPMVKHWPIPSDTSEMILARREGNQVVFLNELRHRQGTALALRFPLDAPGLPAAMALRSRLDAPLEMDGTDYRGVKVLAVAQPVKGTSWISVAKIDQAEAMAGYTQLASWTGLVALVAVFVVMVALLLLWRQQQRSQALSVKAQVAESERGFKALFENMSEGFSYCKMLYDKGIPSDYRFLLTNQPFEQMLGGRSLVGMRATEAFPSIQENTPGLLEMFARVVESGHGEHTEVYLKDFDCWHAVSAYRSTEGHFVVLSADITERKQSETRVLKLNRALTVRSKVNEAIVRHRDLQLLYDDICRIAVEDGGLSLAWVGLQGGAMASVCGKEPREYYRRYFEEAQANLKCGYCPDCPILGALRHGEPRYCMNIDCAVEGSRCRQAAMELGIRSSLALPLKVGGAVRATLNLYAGEPTFFNEEERNLLVELATDISYAMEFLEQQTERRKAEETLGQVNHRLEATLNAMPDTLFEVDQNGLILSCRTAHAGKSGHSAEQPVGQHLDGVFPPEAARTIATAILEAHETGAHFGASYRLGEAPEEEWYELSVSRVEPKEASGYRFLVLARDITARKRAEDATRDLESQLRQSQKLESLGTLASGIAHDFNNILGIILGNATLMEEQHSDPDALQRRTGAIQLAARRGSELVRQMLAFARRADAHFASVSLDKVIQEAAALITETFPKTVELKLELEAGLDKVWADPTQVNQVLLNLCVNARDAMPSGGTLTISLHRASGDRFRTGLRQTVEQGYQILSVSDTGCGMDDYTLSRVFEPFYTTKDKGKGTGLGLSMVFGIMESHGGFIEVESSPGQGTTFHCCFPVADRPEAPGEEISAPPPATHGSETILLVDDENLLRETMCQIFEAKGYRVFPAKDGEEALEVYRNHGPEIDLVLSDFGLPKFDGYELFQRLKALNPKVRVIICSGFVEPRIKESMLQDGVLEIVQKPCPARELHRAVRSVLDRS